MKKISLKVIISTLAVLLVGAITGATININIENGKFNANIQYSEEAQETLVEDDMGEFIPITEIQGEEIPTVEEIDGGLFEDIDTGVSEVEGEYSDLGWSEWYDTSTPEAFKNATLGNCIIANNRFGAQCVSLARVFWWSYANRDVSTCGTGAAKGMMNCAEQNAGDDFLIYWAEDKPQIQAGDWLVFSGGLYGHVGMALGPVNNNYVALLGENQGGRACEGGGAATNIININTKNLIGFYRPKTYVKPTPKPEPTPQPGKEVSYTYVKGDYFSKVLVKLGLDEGNLWGENGTVAYYTKQLIEQDVLDARGNVKIGVPFVLKIR